MSQVRVLAREFFLNSSMKIITKKITLTELNQMAAAGFGNLVKAVIDVDRELFAVDAELHSDLEALLLENGSKQKSLKPRRGQPRDPKKDHGDCL